LRVGSIGLVVLLAGCHKTKVAYVPPAPPPVAATQPETREAAAKPVRTPAPATGPAAPAPESEELGKPVSTEIGLASWYGPPYHNRQAADGSVFDQNALTAAHRTLPMGTVVRVTNVATGQSVVAKIEAFPQPGADPEGRWCVQIGAFIGQDDAVQLKNDLARRYRTAKVIEFSGPTGYWVRINPAVPNQSAAAEIAASIHVPDAESYVVRTN
jgi:rare lipoprotein A